jgi:hypothetical protein
MNLLAMEVERKLSLRTAKAKGGQGFVKYQCKTPCMSVARNRKCFATHVVTLASHAKMYMNNFIDCLSKLVVVYKMFFISLINIG